MELEILPDGVTKKIMSSGKGGLQVFPDGGKVLFHFRSYFINDDGERQLVDDSRQEKQPFELLLGKKFKLEIWETLLKSMRIDEIAEFTCEPKHVGSYPVVSKSLRDMWKKKNDHNNDRNQSHNDQHTHTCGFAAYSQGLGYPDLDEYIKRPSQIIFQIELIKIDLPGEYEEEVWSLSLDKKLASIPKWKEEGNTYYKQGDLENACKKYSQALGSLEQLTTREKPGTKEWLEIDQMKIPLLLNYSQCMLAMKEFYKAIEYLTTVLEKDKNNVKALYRRAKAYHSIYSFKEAKSDYERVKDLDKTLVNTVEQEIKKIQLGEREKDRVDREKYRKAFDK